MIRSENGPSNVARRRWLIWVGLAALAVVVTFTALAGFYIDILWFREVDFLSVFWTILYSRIGPAVAFGLFFFALLYANLLIVRAIRPRYRVYSPEEEYIERYRTAFEPYTKWVLPGVAALFALFAATGVAVRWEEFQLWRVSGEMSFGVTDPVFGRDVAFHALSLPFQKFVQGWLFSSLVVVILVTGGAHYLWGGIRTRAVAERVTPQVKAHLSVLLGLAVLVKAWGYRLEQFDLLTSARGTVTGASYTDVNAQLPALRLLVVIALVCTVLFLVNIRFRGWALPALGIGLLALTSIVAGAIYPAAIQRFRVAPQELQQETEFIERNVEFTRRAYGLDRIERQSFAAEEQLSLEEVEDNEQAINNIRLWNPDVLRQSYLQLQRIRPYYEFVDVDVDRYTIDGERQPTMVTVRQISQDGIRGGGQTWQNRHLFYTHGFGAVASRVDQVTSEGAPTFIARDIPTIGPLAPQLDQPRLYFQEKSDVPFVVVRTDLPEFDFPTSEEGEEQFARTTYDGEGGIEIGGYLRRLAFAWRYRDVNLLISGLINSESRMLINTDLQSRVQKVAPFLKYDFDPYTAIVDGRIVWIWDAYTTTDAYPYSERVDLGEVTQNHLRGRANYIRNSVKVTVDAYDGDMTFWVVDEEDPIIEAWQRVFPDLFTPGSQAPMSLREHFRYPEDLFRVQSNQYASYHVTNPGQFYAKEDFWSVPLVARDPRAQAEVLEPYYMLVQLPGEQEERFVLFTPFTPAGRPNMVGWIAGFGDPAEYGRLVSFDFPRERNVLGPEQAAALITQDPDVSRDRALFDQLGSRVIYGDLLAVPIGSSFLYVQPLYLRSEQEATAIPELKRVVVVHSNAVSMAENLGDALAASFGEAVEIEEPAPVDEEPTEEPEPDPTTPVGDLAELLGQAQEHFEAADAALRRGDLAAYQREIRQAQAAIEAAIALTAPQANE